MHRLLRRLGMTLCAASALQGCISIHAPLTADEDYPVAWGELIPLGPDCTSLDGTYQNSGITIDAKGVAHPVRLTAVLDIESNAPTVTLLVRTRQQDRNGDSFVTLGAVPNDSPHAIHELENCYCIRQTLACTQLNETYWSVPNFGLGGSQRNFYLALSRDRALIAKLQNYHLDIMLAIPIFGIQEPWARFNWVEK